jgi:hypothetical protein
MLLAIYIWVGLIWFVISGMATIAGIIEDNDKEVVSFSAKMTLGAFIWPLTILILLIYVAFIYNRAKD